SMLIPSGKDVFLVLCGRLSLRIPAGTPQTTKGKTGNGLMSVNNSKGTKKSPSSDLYNKKGQN
ncbi:hypothetical protein NL293_27790, partial [Klebsiella pneumoniae]|nr:hypothetical protein [Klebsiella pneumoniae]